MKSPLTIQYSDLIKDAKKRLSFMKATYPAKVFNGEMGASTKDRKIATAERLVKILERWKREPQIDLFQVNEEMNKR